MRRDFLHYFADDTLIAVIGMKFFGPGNDSVNIGCIDCDLTYNFICFPAVCPAQRAVAVEWIRTNRGIEVSAVRDFGVDPISTNAARVFAQDVGGVPNAMLPGVHPALWAANRHVPIVPVEVDPIPEKVTPHLCVQFIYTQDNDNRLYSASTVPVITIPGGTLQNVLHNLPEGAAALDDFNINLANVFFWVMKGASYEE